MISTIPKTFWTKERIDYLKQYYNKIPAISIAIDLGCGCTKNMVVGKANRLGLNKTFKNKICSW